MNWRVSPRILVRPIAVITTWLIPFADFGDKNETWTRRLIIIAFISALIFLVALLY